jgi:chlorophyll synthase
VAALLLGQVALMSRLLAAPRARAAWYNGTGTTLYVLGMLVAAFALRPLVQGGP